MPGSRVGRSESPVVFGQSGPLRAVEGFLDATAVRPAALLVEGEVGSGKTVLWTATVAAARARGYRVLACHPGESEAGMAFAALGDLLATVPDDAYEQLPAPQRRALRVATLMEDPEGEPPGQRSVSVATLGIIRSLAEQRPVLVAIDDLRWADVASVRVLDFAFRRLAWEPVGVVAVVRADDTPALSWLRDDGGSVPDRHRVTPAPLGADALDPFLRARLEESFPPSALSQIAAASGGNPLFALEIARGLLRGEIRRDTGTLLSIPRSLRQLVEHRLASLPADVRELLFLAAAVPEPTLDLLQRAAPGGASPSAAVASAERAGVVEVTGDRVGFAHPLFASTLYHELPAERRRELHGFLARIVENPDERARHLALATDGRDAAVAAALDDAARRAALRGAPDAAAALAEQASRLTPDTDAAARDRRDINAAEFHFAAGDTVRARRILERIASDVASGPVRASILRRLAKVRYRNDSCAVAADLLTHALREAGDDAELRAGIERDLAWAVVLCGDVREAAEHARASLRLAEANGGEAGLAEPLAATAMVDFLLGKGIRSKMIDRAVALEQPRPDVPIEWQPTMMLGMMLKWAGDLATARHHFDRLHRRTIESGEEASLPFLLGQMSESETWAGDWSAARGHAQEAHSIALQTGQEPIRASALYATALVEAHLGLHDDARASAHAGLRLAEDVGSVVWMMQNQAVLGFVDLSVDDHAAAHAWLAPLVAWQDVVGIREPGILRFVPDEVEASIALGNLDTADRLLRSYEAGAARLRRPWAILAGARCRALHAAANGDAGAAAASLEQAIEEHAYGAPPFERGRALFTLGSIQRRTLRRKAARDSLRAALAIFDGLGAPAWASKVRRVLRTEAPARVAGSTPVLTPAEQRVAELVAAGSTNREAADRLFVSVRAVEVHLTSIYRKLGISSRTQLAVRMPTQPLIQVPADASRAAGDPSRGA